MPNPFGDNMFNPQPAYGQVAQMQELAKEAPISGTPIPGAGTTSAPATQGGPPPVPAGPMATPYAPAQQNVTVYSSQLATTWRALAKTPGASKEIKQIAAQAKKRVQVEYDLSQQIGH